MPKHSPVGALLGGLVAGAAGAALQTLFFKATSRIAPSGPKDAFEPPEREQRDEMQTQTVARRLVEGLAQRGPLDDEQKRLGGELVHYGFGAGWGAVYGLARETWPALGGAAGAAGFATVVWMVGDNLILPLFRLSAVPQRYPAKLHGYALAAHLVYGAGVWGTYELIDRAGIPTAGLVAALLGRRARKLAIPARLRARGRDLQAHARRAFEQTLARLPKLQLQSA
jgi:hypothetical protein